MTVASTANVRQTVVAATAAFLAGIILRPQIASALIARGDQSLSRASASDALRYYRRALAFAAEDATAVDRFAFAATLERDPRALREAIDDCSRSLRLRPRDWVIRADRAFALRLLGDFRNAEHDFALAGNERRDPSLVTLAGYAALRSGDRRAARRLWQAALALDGSFRPAVLALTRHRP